MKNMGTADKVSRAYFKLFEACLRFQIPLLKGKEGEFLSYHFKIIQIIIYFKVSFKSFIFSIDFKLFSFVIYLFF